jgi:hypothetical protein
VQLDQEPAIMVRQPDSTVQSPLQNHQLMSKRRVLSFKPQLDLNGEARTAKTKPRSPIMPRA